MNKAITEGVLLMPPAFENGLDVWSSGNGTPGSDTYDGAANAAFVPADQDFGGCLELQKTSSVQKLRHMGETPLLPGCYLRVTARIKAVSGNLPDVRIAGWAGGAGGSHVGGLIEVGPSQTLQSYGDIVEVSAIIGAGDRNGVDMVWGSAPIYGHFGLDLTGPNGGIVRIDDLIVEDITRVFLRDMMAWVDVRDYGAVGDGVTDDQPAFEAADAAANGREVLVSKGTYFLADSVTFESRTRFEGTVTMPDDKILSLTKNYELPSYIDAFGDEVLAFKKAFQALLNNSDHESLDMGGRRITVTEPIDMQAAVANKTTYEQRRKIHNGQFYCVSSSDWNTDTVTSQATYSKTDPLTLSNVTNVANVPVGALIEATGVGREVYVRAVNIGAQELTLSNPLFDAEGTQNYTFRRFKYMLDFSGFSKLSKFTLADIEFQCSGHSSAIMLAPTGLIFHVRDCFVTRPKDRGITSIGNGCQGMLVDRCQFLSDEVSTPAQNRVSIALNANANDVKLRDNRITQFRHFAVLSGTSSVITSNHWFQGDSEPNGIRTAGLVLTSTHNRATISGNYIDNCFIEWVNEHDHSPDFSSEYSFSALNVSNNIFQTIGVAPWFKFFVVKPHGPGHFINGLNVVGNMFRGIQGTIDRIEAVDTTYADLDFTRMKNIRVEGNSFNAITQPIQNPLVLDHSENTAASTWAISCAGPLPFGGYAQNVEAVTARAKIQTASNVAHYSMPYVVSEQGGNRDQIHLKWGTAVKGDVTVRVRMDNY